MASGATSWKSEGRQGTLATSAVFGRGAFCARRLCARPCGFVDRGVLLGEGNRFQIRSRLGRRTGATTTTTTSMAKRSEDQKATASPKKKPKKAPLSDAEKYVHPTPIERQAVDAENTFSMVSDTRCAIPPQTHNKAFSSVVVAQDSRRLTPHTLSLSLRLFPKPAGLLEHGRDPVLSAEAA